MSIVGGGGGGGGEVSYALLERAGGEVEYYISLLTVVSHCLAV